MLGLNFNKTGVNQNDCGESTLLVSEPTCRER